MRYSDRSNDDVEITFDVKKYGAYTPVSDELLMDAGVIEDTRTPKTFAEYFPTRRARLRWRLSLKVAGLRLRLGSWIAGVDLADQYDD
jgi:hypothetical protein